MINRVAEADDAAAPVIASIGSLLAAWNAAPDQTVGAVAGDFAARAVLTRADLAGSLPRSRRRRPFGRIRHSRPLLARRMARDQRSLHDDCHAAFRRPSRKRHYRARRSGVADHLFAFRPGAGKHDAARRLALPRTRPPRRARDHRPAAGALLRAPRRARRRPRRTLELADSQITYRQRYFMVAARAPVIDLVMLDPNNPRSVAFQLDRIETHLAALPGRHAAGRLSPVQQIAAAIATRLRTDRGGCDRRERSSSKPNNR